MKKGNEKGFTMVELLSVLVILGVLLTVAVPSMSKYLQKGQDFSYETAERSLYEASQNYILTLPLLNNTTSKVEVNFLINKRYLKSIKDPKNQNRNCDEKSYVNVKKLNTFLPSSITENYAYNIHLECPTGYKSKKIIYPKDIYEQMALAIETAAINYCNAVGCNSTKTLRSSELYPTYLNSLDNPSDEPGSTSSCNNYEVTISYNNSLDDCNREDVNSLMNCYQGKVRFTCNGETKSLTFPRTS